MIVSSFNIQNNYSDYSIDKTKEIINYIEKYKIDILGLQEVFSPCGNDIKNCINNKYCIRGNYRFQSKLLLRRFNEKTPIITKYPILKHKTYHLPHLPSLLKRVMTKVVIDIDGREVSVYNTHLDFKYMYSREQELKKIYKIISKDTNPIILMGDFNLKNNKQIFIDFENQLKDIGINRIEFNNKTLKISKYKREIDHIFISKDFTLNSNEIIRDLEISDHYPIMADITFK